MIMCYDSIVHFQPVKQFQDFCRVFQIGFIQSAFKWSQTYNFYEYVSTPNKLRSLQKWTVLVGERLACGMFCDLTDVCNV